MELTERLSRLCLRAEKEGFIKLNKDPIASWWKVFTDHPWEVLIVGDYNAGKSTLINALLGEELLKVGPIPTTTEFTTVKLAEAIEITDSPGFNEPGTNDERKKEFIAKFEAVQDKMDLILLVVSDQSIEQSDLFERLGAVIKGKRVIIVINEKTGYKDEEREVLVSSLRAKVQYLASSVQLIDILCLNAESGLRAKTEGKLELLTHSRIEKLEHLLREEERAFRLRWKNADQALLNILEKELLGFAEDNLIALALLAETMVVRQLFKGGLSISFNPMTLLSESEIENLKDMFLSNNIVELRPIGKQSYVDHLNDNKARKPIIRDLQSIDLEYYNPVVALVGLEIRDCKITKNGGDIFIINCDLRRSRLVAMNRCNAWIGGSQLGEVFNASSVDLRDRSLANIISCSFSGGGGLCHSDETSRANLVGVRRQIECLGSISGEETKESIRVQAVGYVPLPMKPSDVYVFRRFLICKMSDNELRVYRIDDGKLTDRWFVYGEGNKIKTLYINSHAATILISLEKKTDAYLATIRDGRLTAMSGQGCPSLVHFDREFTLCLINGDNTLWGIQKNQVFIYSGLGYQQSLQPIGFTQEIVGQWISSVSSLYDGSLLAITSHSGENVFFWSLHRIQRDGNMRVISWGDKYDGRGLEISPSGNRIFVQFYDGSKYSWCIGKPLQNEPFNIYVPSSCHTIYWISWLPDDTHIAEICDKPPRAVIYGPSKDNKSYEMKGSKQIEQLISIQYAKWISWKEFFILDNSNIVTIFNLQYKP